MGEIDYGWCLVERREKPRENTGQTGRGDGAGRSGGGKVDARAADIKR